MFQPKREPSDPLTVAAEIVAAFVAKNHLPAAELPAVIQSVHAAVVRLANGTMNPNSPAESGALVASIRKSIAPDYLVCFETGHKFQSLRRHLRALGMTPDEYRAKWKLPADYPMVAPNYAAKRAELAKRAGLGRQYGGSRPRKLAEPSQATMETSDL
jgi:predicted transcriptional regulator